MILGLGKYPLFSEKKLDQYNTNDINDLAVFGNLMVCVHAL